MSSSSTPLVWLITGTSTGFGRLLTEGALERGDKVIATARARSISQLDDLKVKGADILELDVTDTLDNLKKIAKTAWAIHGRIDVIVNNAGYILVGAIEENTPEETLKEFDTNVFGGVNVARAFLPYMRERKAGTFVWMGSIAGWCPVPYSGFYGASKWSTRCVSSTLHEEISPLGLRSVCIDFGYFRTSFLDPAHRSPRTGRISDYQGLMEQWEAGLEAYNGNQPGDPVKAVRVIVDLVHGEGVAKNKPFPTSLLLGSDAYNMAKAAVESSLANIEAWKDVTVTTDI